MTSNPNYKCMIGRLSWDTAWHWEGEELESWLPMPSVYPCFAMAGGTQTMSGLNVAFAPHLPGLSLAF